MRLKVEMGVGHDKGQRVTTEDGELVEGVANITWRADALDSPKVVLELFASKCDFDLGLSEKPTSEQ